MAEMQKQWYVLQTLTGQEQKAQRQIVAQARSAGMCDYFDIPVEPKKGEVLNEFNVVVPTERVKEMKDGKARLITRKLCPGYVVIRMALYSDPELRQINQELWQFFRSIPGVIGFLGGTSTKPRPITEAEADNLLRRVVAEDDVKKAKLKINFQVGETVRVNEGPFMNFNGTIDQIDPNSGRLQISVSIFGRSAPVTLEYWQVEPITDHPEGV